MRDHVWIALALVSIVAVALGLGFTSSRRTSSVHHRVYNAHPIPFCVGAPCSALIQTCSGGAPTVKNVEYTLVDESIIAGPEGPVLVCAWEDE
jgi:hypothetical protein